MHVLKKASEKNDCFEKLSQEGNERSPEEEKNASKECVLIWSP